MILFCSVHIGISLRFLLFLLTEKFPSFHPIQSRKLHKEVAFSKRRVQSFAQKLLQLLFDQQKQPIGCCLESRHRQLLIDIIAFHFLEIGNETCRLSSHNWSPDNDRQKFFVISSDTKQRFIGSIVEDCQILMRHSEKWWLTMSLD